MGRHFGRVVASALAIGLATSPASAAGSACWTIEDVAAAKIRDLQSMLMVAGLRCRSSGVDVLTHYNKFVNTNRAAIVSINSQLKKHFNGALGPVEGQRSYDRFATSLANMYGAGGAGSEDCADMAELARQAVGANGSAEALLAVAEQRGLAPQLPSALCPMTIATR